MASAPSIPDSPFPIPDSKDIVLAFSGGLDTSFCIPWLKERGYDVHTVFADTGGVDDAERQYIEQRAAELGASSHVTVDGGPAIWSNFVKPFVWAGEGYQGQYPLLVSDRYLIVEAALKRAAEIGTRTIAHGCTGMGNDQVRFDLTVKALGDYEIIAPIREIQKEHAQVRAYEQAWLEARGFSVRSKQKAYTINENLLGLTMSGGEIDRWQEPGEGARGWCAPRAEWPNSKMVVTIGFEQGEARTLNGEALPGPCPAGALEHPVCRLRCGPRHLHRGHNNRAQGAHRIRGAGSNCAAGCAPRAGGSRAVQGAEPLQTAGRQAMGRTGL
jgi:argininosuccinate synthase